MYVGSRRTLLSLGNLAPETRALIARMTTKPSQPRARLIDTIIRALKANGIWPALDALWVPGVAEDSQAARLNWLSSSFTLTPVSSPTFTADRGYAGDASAAYLDTNFVPSTNGVKFTQDNGSIGVYINAGADTSASAVIAMGALGTPSGSFIRARDDGARIGGRVNQTSTVVGSGTTVATRKGLTSLDRSASTGFTTYRNGSALETIVATSAPVVDVSLFLLGARLSGFPVFSPGDNRIAFAFVGGSLGATKQAALYTIISAALTAIGAN